MQENLIKEGYWGYRGGSGWFACSPPKVSNDKIFFFISTNEKHYNRSERKLDESGISVAPPPRSRLAGSSSLPAPPTKHTHETRQRRPDQPASSLTNQADVKKIDSESSENDESSNTSESDTNTSSTDDEDGHSLNEGKLFYFVNVLLFYADEHHIDDESHPEMAKIDDNGSSDAPDGTFFFSYWLIITILIYFNVRYLEGR